MTLADRLTEIQEAHIDTALLHLSRARDEFVRADENHAACRIDEAMEIVQAVCRENRK